nr:MAG TPA: hypothetical protein [Caudoviricetes sp.]
MCYIATASLAVAAAYNKNPDADFVAIEHEHMDAIVEYFKDHAFYKYNTELTMDGQLKFKGKPVIAYIGEPVGNKKTTRGAMTADEIKQALNKMYGATKYTREAAGV